LGLGHETGSDQTNEASVFDHRSEHAYVIQAFDADRYQAGLLHCITVPSLHSQWRINGFFS